jgi:2-iminobutanoate/2-iminopropanoate deaminase
MAVHRAIVKCGEVISAPSPPADERTGTNPTAQEPGAPRERREPALARASTATAFGANPTSPPSRADTEAPMQRREINPSSVFDSRRYGFSQAVAVGGGDHLFISGQVGVDTEERVIGHDLAAQTEAALANLAHVLDAAGGTLQDVVSLRIYVVASAASDLTPVGVALRSRFGSDRPPASTWLVISALAEPELLIEIEAQAVMP